ncbi:Uncharacterised protein [Vibrio cholerae]|nr:Uncharacterised protein [Vibrio cholerae]
MYVSCLTPTDYVHTQSLANPVWHNPTPVVYQFRRSHR